MSRVRETLPLRTASVRDEGLAMRGLCGRQLALRGSTGNKTPGEASWGLCPSRGRAGRVEGASPPRKTREHEAVMSVAASGALGQGTTLDTRAPRAAASVSHGRVTAHRPAPRSASVVPETVPSAAGSGSDAIGRPRTKVTAFSEASCQHAVMPGVRQVHAVTPEVGSVGCRPIRFHARRLRQSDAR